MKPLFDYMFRADYRRGKLFWKNTPPSKPFLLGKEAGYTRKDRCGTVRSWVTVFSKKYPRAKIIFCMKHGEFVKGILDHKNRNSLDDRPCNLRPATHAQNIWNQKPRKKTKNSLPTGVRKMGDKFQARISHMMRLVHIGTFNTIAAAERAYKKKRKDLRGDFA